MNQQVFFTDMFPDYEPPEELEFALSQAAVVAADIDPTTRSVSVALYAEQYIPKRLLDQTSKDIRMLYGLERLELTATHPETQLHKIEPLELMFLFVEQNSMTRGSLAGAKWEWNDCELTVKLVANGKAELEELIPVVQKKLRERFAAPVTIRIEAGEALDGQALFDAMESMRAKLREAIPVAAPVKKEEKKPDPQTDTFYGKPFRAMLCP